MNAPGPFLPVPGSFAELFNFQPDVLEGGYTEYMQPFDVDSNDTPTALHDVVLTASSEAPLYTTLAQSSKASCIHAVQALANNHAAEADSTNVAPIITAALFECIKMGELTGENPDNITSGLLIYLITLGLGSDGTMARVKQTMYSTIYSGGGAPQISQVVELAAATLNLAMTALALLQVYRAYSVILNLMLGDGHRVATYFQNIFIPGLE